MVSIIIPSRSPQYLQKTIDDILLKAEGDIEIIVVLDGIWPEDYNWSDPRIRVVHHGTVHDSKGMRESINMGMSIARGKYVMKCDEHIMFDKGFDKKLSVDCEDNWLVIPRRHRLEADEWRIIEDGRSPVDYMKIDYPYQRPFDKTCGLHGSEDKKRYSSRKDILIDDVMTMQGSCYFMSKKLWDSIIVKMDDEHYGPFTQEAQELTNKVWLSGGRCIVNKKTWYAHMHKGKKGKGYGFSNEQYKKHCEWNERGRIYCIEYWLNTHDYKYDFEWLLKKFWPVDGWPENWKEQIKVDREKDYSTLNYKDDYWLSNLRK
jgi:glycosyltransferase involved in cell wall biosynthesis